MHRSLDDNDVQERLQDDDSLEAALEQARRDALLDHKRTGDPIVVWENGQVVWIPADKIEIHPPDQPD